MPETRLSVEPGLAPNMDAADPPMRAAFLSPAWPADLVANGIATYVGNMVEALQSLGHRPCVLTARVGELVDDDPPVCDLSTWSDKPSLARRVLSGLARRLAPNAPRISENGPAIAKAARVAATEHGARILEMEESFGWAAQVAPQVPLPVVVRLHGPWFLNGPILGVERDRVFEERVRREGQALRLAAGITSPSRNVLDQVREKYGLDLPEAAIIPNPGPIVPLENRWRAADSDGRTILFVGRFDGIKGGDVIIDAFERIIQSHPRALLRFVGPDGGLIDGRGRKWSLPEYLAERAPEAMAQGRIECMGRVPNSSIPALRRRSFITVVCSRHENFPMTVLEATATGSPLVASRAGGIPEIVDDGETALLVPPDDPEALALAIGRLFDNPDLAARLGERAGEVMARDFHPQEIARRTADYHAEIAQRHNR